MVALIHDVLIVLGVVALVNWLGLVDARLNLVTVAAFLTLIGYSINDTIVVFDRIRENRGTGKTRLAEIIDKSINQTLARTIRTTSTTWIVVLILLAMNFGTNSSLEGFAFILTIGVLIGTYSSIFVASPTLLYLPWLWEKCGSSGKAFFRKCVPFWIGSSIGLLVVAVLQGTLDIGGDFSVAAVQRHRPRPARGRSCAVPAELRPVREPGQGRNGHSGRLDNRKRVAGLPSPATLVFPVSYPLG